MAKKISDTYEYKEATMRSALEYASFGWQIGKNSSHYSKKLKRDVVTLRRDFSVGANPTISDCEKDYLKLERGKLPAKYRTHVLPKFLGRMLVCILTIAILLVGVAIAFVGIHDALLVEKKVWALYNTAVEAGLTEEPYYVLEDESGIIMPDAYIAFVQENPTLNTYAELVDFAGNRVSEKRLSDSYNKWLEKFGLYDTGAPESALNSILDIVREKAVLLKSEMYISGLPLWANLVTLIGAGFFFLSIILIIIEAVAKKRRKKKTMKKCVKYMKECSKIASDALYELKTENRELMTKNDQQLYDLETMFTQVMGSHGDEFE